MVSTEFVILGGMVIVAIILFLISYNFIVSSEKEVKEYGYKADAEEIADLVKRIAFSTVDYVRVFRYVRTCNVTVKNGLLKYGKEGIKFSFFVPKNVLETELKDVSSVCILKIKNETMIMEECPRCDLDSVCTKDECKEDCLDCYGPSDECIGDGFCNLKIGENCMNSPDCSCDGLLCCPPDPEANEFGCVDKHDLDEGEECFCDNECKAGLTCNPTTSDFKDYGKACCPPGKSWNGNKCVAECLTTTRCQNKWWPNNFGGMFVINEPVFFCNVYEVCDSRIKDIIKEIVECCNTKCSGNCHRMCIDAVKDSGLDKTDTPQTRKKCYGLYAIYGLGPASRWMHGYWCDEICCKIGPPGFCSCSGTTKKGCSGGFCPLPSDAASTSVSCKGCVGIGNCQWKSDSDMKQNTCCFGEAPAHASLTKIRTGVCTDYAIAVVTLLRSVGYEKNEVFATCGPGHMYNLVKFPGETKYRFVDVVGNKLYISGITGPDFYSDRCSYGYRCGGCTNDEGAFKCPPGSETIGRGC